MNKKFFIWFVAIIIAVVAVVFFWDNISLSLRQKRVERLAEEFKKIEREDYERAMADTYGGKTPQETLQMYIDAVEKGDYELASKYFVLDKQEAELQSFRGASNVSIEQVQKYISELRNALGLGGKYSSDGSYFSFDGDILISLIKYPNGIWKILEI